MIPNGVQSLSLQQAINPTSLTVGVFLAVFGTTDTSTVYFSCFYLSKITDIFYTKKFQIISILFTALVNYSRGPN